MRPPCPVLRAGALRSVRDHVRAGTPGHGLFEVIRRGDDGPFASALDELHGRADLGAHAALGKLPRLEITSRLGQRHPVEEAVVVLAEPDRHLLRARGDDENGHAQMRGEEAGGEVLVHDGLHAPIHAQLLLDDGDAPAAAGDDDEPRAQERSNGARLDNAQGAGRGHEAPEATAGVLDHDPVVAALVALCVGGRVAAADGLARVLEGRVPGIHDGLGQHAHDAVGQAASPQLAHELVPDDVADAALGVGDAHVERQARSELGLGGQLGAEQDEAHLRPIAVRQDHAPAVGDEGGHVRRRVASVLELLGYRAFLTIANQRIAADGDDGGSLGEGHAEAFTRRPSSRSAPAKQARGARAMPAPIWPMPASRWAMPVLITGWTPLSTTRRASMAVGVPAKPRAGIPKSALRASVMPYIRCVYPMASSGVPPTKRTMAGAAAMAKPPMPMVSVMALSPRSGLASGRP